jgi:hypothetical protein
MKCFLPLIVLLIAACFLINSSHASASQMEWQTGLALQLPAYNTTLEASASWYMDSFTWNDANASTLTFNETYMLGGTRIPSLTISSQNANLTFTELSFYKETRVIALGSSTAHITLEGYTKEPTIVTIDGVENSTFWSYNALTDTLTLAPTLNGSSLIVLDYGAAPLVTLTAEDAAAIGVVFGVVALSVGVGVTFVKRRENKD